MSSIPIVQGVAVASDNGKYGGANEALVASEVPGEQELRQLRQEPIKKYQDVVWAGVFVVHLVVMIGLIAVGLSSNQGMNAQGFGGVIFLVCATGLCAVGFASLSISSMMTHTETLVRTALIFSVVTSLAIGILGFMMGSMIMGILGLISFAVGCWYAYVVQSRIPFAAANLKTALLAVKQNMGLTVIAYGMTGLAFGWSILWFLGVGNALAGSQLPIVFLMFLSYYWVHQVLQNTMHVTSAGTVATWWFVPDEASSFWSNGLNDSFFRATTYSFGSICFGSLLVAFVQALRALEHYARDNDDLNFLICFIQCILGCIQSIIEYLNKWAYVYVGMYGFSYLEAGRNVIQLFQNKGWTVIISDDLCDNVLFMVSVAVGLASGLVGLVLGSMDPNMFVSLGYDHAGGPAFLVGTLTGFLLSSVMMSVVGSSVNTVIVCYAEDPASFQMNHPQLATDMRTAWMQAFPGIVY